MRVLMVCLGNICRSPTAEAALIEAARERGLEVQVDSAGTGAWHVGNPPDPRMTAAGATVGLTLDGAARQVRRDDLDDFDLILAMDRENLRDLRALFSGTHAHVRLFREDDPQADGDLDVPDPYYGGPDGFAEVVQICRRTAARLAERLERDAP